MELQAKQQLEKELGAIRRASADLSSFFYLSSYPIALLCKSFSSAQDV